MPNLMIQRKLENKVAAIIASQGLFPFFSMASLLLVVSWLYGACMRFRRVFYRQGLMPSHRLPGVVISVGNLCLGGTGKTPMTIYLAELLCDMGFLPAVISRGYKGLYEKMGAVVSDGRNLLCDAGQAGDEPYLMANLLQCVPVVVGRDRVAAGKMAMERFKPDVLILDDGFQHQRLQRDLNLLLLDACNPFGNSHVLPRGALREPKSAIVSADAIIMTRSENAASSSYLKMVEMVYPQPVFRASHRSVLRCILPAGQNPDEVDLAQSHPGDPGHLRGRHIFTFSGLARNEAFWDSLHRYGARIGGTLAFADHHAYQLADAENIDRSARSAGCDCLVTTDKDYVRLPANFRFSVDLIVMGIRIEFDEDQERWRDFILDRLKIFAR